jgi:hypothetical protein
MDSLGGGPELVIINHAIIDDKNEIWQLSDTHLMMLRSVSVQ